jgi:hypothetical protein
MTIHTGVQKMFSKSAQRGFLTLDASLALVVSAFIAFLAFESQMVKDDTDLARQQGDAIGALRGAAHKLVMSNYVAYQRGDSIDHRKGDGTTVNIPAGSAAGQSLRPTVATLRTLDLGVNTAQDSGFYKALANSGYDIFITRSAQCTTDPAAETCRVSGLVCFAEPVRRHGGQLDTVAQGVMLNRLGSYGYATLLGGADATLTSAPGQASEPNPYGARAGTVCARFGWGSDTDDYVRRFDSRDPFFQGNLSVAGNASVGGDLGVGKGTSADGTSTCALGSILKSGQILSRSATCIRRAWMDGATGQVGVADAAGTTRVLLDGSTGGLSSRDATGADRAGIRYNGAGQSELYADNLLNNAGTAGIRADGSVFGASATFNALALPNTVAIGGVCTTEGGISWSLFNGAYVAARCTGGRWVLGNGVTLAVSGAACGTTDGVAGVSSNGAQLICQGGSWVNLSDRMGRTVLMASYLASDATVVPKPTCLASSVGSVAYMALGSEQQGVQYANRYLTDSGTSWTAVIRTGEDNPIRGDVVVLTYCVY